MKVICIDSTNRQDEYGNTSQILEEGKEYTVDRKVLGFGTSGKMYECYKLAEYTDKNYNHLFDTNRFIPLSSIDETTFSRNYKKEISYSDLLQWQTEWTTKNDLL